MKCRWLIGSKKIKHVVVETPVREIAVDSQNSVADVGLKSQSSDTFQDLNSKNEIFWDSQTWLESDCDDFFSVNGDMTPSFGNTPIHESIIINETGDKPEKSPQPSETSGHVLETSPITKKTTLVEFLRENNSTNQVNNDDQNSQSADYSAGPKSTIKSLCTSTAKREKGKVQCCLPILVRSLSCSENKKKRMSPDHSS